MERRGARARAGEINTLQGNLNWVASREHSLTAPVWKGREAELLPLCNASESDSANLDHVAELLMRTGVAATQARRRGRPLGLGGWGLRLGDCLAWHILAGKPDVGHYVLGHAFGHVLAVRRCSSVCVLFVLRQKKV